MSTDWPVMPVIGQPSGNNAGAGHRTLIPPEEGVRVPFSPEMARLIKS